MPPPVVGFTRPAASPTATTRSAKVRATGPSGSIFRRGAGIAVGSTPTLAQSLREQRREALARLRRAHQANARVRHAVARAPARARRSRTAPLRCRTALRSPDAPETASRAARSAERASGRPEAERPMKPIAGAAREHAARARGWAARCCRSSTCTPHRQRPSRSRRGSRGGSRRRRTRRAPASRRSNAPRSMITAWTRLLCAATDCPAAPQKRADPASLRMLSLGRSCPASASSRAVIEPAGPAPMTTTSRTSRDINACPPSRLRPLP